MKIFSINICGYMTLALACVLANVNGQAPATVTPSSAATLPAIPPSVYSVRPPGVRRGSTAVITIEGRSLSGARAVLFDAPGFTATVTGITDLPDPPRMIRIRVDTGAQLAQGTKQEAKLEVTAGPGVAPGVHEFRVQTPLGTSNTVALDVGTLPEIKEVEPNTSLAESQRVELPGTLVGSISMPGNVDTFQFDGKAGQEMVFQPVAASLGSSLRSVLVLRDVSGRELSRVGENTRGLDSVLTYKLPADGRYSISISDMEHRGGYGFFYRLSAGALPYVTEVFPLGVRAGQTAEVSVAGANLGEVHTIKVQAPADAQGWTTIPVHVKTAAGDSINKIELAVGNEPEVAQKEPNDSAATAQPITVPVAINGHVSSAANARSGAPGGNYFRFRATKGQHLIIEVAAARLGSPLDSVIEILDAAGREIPQATIRCVAETAMTLADRNSSSKSIRVLSSNELHENDYLLIGEELVQLEFIPDQPDADVSLKGINGERYSYLNTSREVHPVGQPVYKAQILVPGADLFPNGMPVVSLTMRNDDGGPGYGRDSRLDFTAPSDGDYLLHIKDARGLAGEKFAYRMTVHDVQPDFALSASPINPNVPRGGRTPVEVIANRRLGYDGPIEITVKGLPNGIAAEPSFIPAGEDSTTLILVGAPDAPDGSTASPITIEGQARIGNRPIIHVADADQPVRVACLVASPDVLVAADPTELTLQPGQTATVSLRVTRMNAFKGRLPCNVLNLPRGVRVENVGLNGVLVTENETSRTFTLRAEPWAQPVTQPIYVVGTVESNTPTQHASGRLMLKVRQPQLTDASPRTGPSAAGRTAAANEHK